MKDEKVKEHVPKKIVNGLVSVRSQKTGRGSALRVFVDTQKMLCFSEMCLNKYSTIPQEERKTPWCDHLKEGSETIESAKEIKITMESLKDLNLEEETLQLMATSSDNGQITLYEVNSSTVITPSFGAASAQGILTFTHVKDFTCKLRGCKSVKHSQHVLLKKTGKICLHSLLALKSNRSMEKDDASEVKSKIDHIKSVDILLDKVTTEFPSMSDEDLRKCLPMNKVFVDKLW